VPATDLWLDAARRVGFGRRLGIALLLVPAIVVVSFIGVNVMLEVKLSSAKRVNLSLAGSPDGGGANFLLIGSDTRAFATDPNDKLQFGNAGGGQRSDTIMVLHTEPGSDRALLVSFPRDLWVDIPGHGHAKINAAFNYGPQSIIDTLSSNFNVPIQHYVEVNFESFRDVVNAVGTVPVYFPAPVRDEFSLLYVSYPGCVQLDGEGALAFVRSRHLELLNPTTGRWQSADPIPDIGRIARQQALLRVIGKHAMDAALTNPFTANSVADAAIGHLTLDSDFGRGDVFALAYGLGGGSGDTPGPLSITVPTTPGNRGGQDVLLTTSGSEAVIAQLRNFDTPIASPSSTTAAAGSSPGRSSTGSAASTPTKGTSASPVASLAPVPGGC
jgi:LCP family protein required for cell wall assembly